MGAKPRAELAAVEEWHGSWSVAFCPVVAVVPRLTRMGQALTADLSLSTVSTVYSRKSVSFDETIDETATKRHDEQDEPQSSLLNLGVPL